MPHTVTKTFIPLPPEAVYQGSKDYVTLVKYLPELERVTMLEETPARNVSRWEWRAMGRRFVQVHIDEWDDATLGNRFYAGPGDFDQWEGSYSVAAAPGGTEFTLDLKADVKVPLIGPLLKSLIAKIIEGNAEATVKAVKAVCLERSGRAFR